MVRHFLRISDLDRSVAQSILERAKVIKDKAERSKVLAGKIVILVFEKASTRTRVSFEAAVKHLGGDTVFMTPMESQLGRSEPLRDTARVLSRYGQCVVVRTFGQNKLDELANFSSVPIINALTDECHPCQVMSDVLTIYERTPDLSSLKVAWIGDGNNMAHSWIEAATHFPFELRLAFPRGYEPKTEIIQRAVAARGKVFITYDPEEAIAGAHYVNTDVWASMGQEAENEERKKVFQPYQVNAELMRLAHPKAKIMHCLPAHRGEEITDELLEGPSSIVWDQAENRLHMQKALLEWALA